MFFRKAVNIIIITAICLLCCKPFVIQAYTQVSTSGSAYIDEGPKIFKALNLDLIFPKSFNSSENVISTTPTGPLPTTRSSVTDIDSDGRQQYNPLPPQSNEQTNRDDDDNGGDNQRPLYVTPSPNEAALYTDNGNNNKENNAQVVTQNPINIQQQQQPNDNRNNNAAAKEQQNIATGRAVDYHTGYPFGQLITPLIKNAPRPIYSSSSTSNNNRNSNRKPIATASSSSSNAGKIVVYPQAVYPQKPPSRAEIDKLRGKGNIKDRFTPSEAVASNHYKSGNHNHHNHAPSYSDAGKHPAASNVVNTYVPPKNLYSFPPNNINYPSATQDNKLALPTSIVNSYSPPPSGPLKDANYPLVTASSNDSGYKYAGPLNLGYLPTADDNGGGSGKDQKPTDDGNDDSNGGGADNGGMDDSIGVLPASAMDVDNAGDMNDMDQMDMQDTQPNNDSHDDHAYDTEKEYPTPPPEWLKQHPEAAHHPEIEVDHDPHPYHHSFPSFPLYNHYPEIIYDDLHHEHHHHVEPPPTTTEAPPPEPPPEPRVKKYSYFYIGRKLWYIPLYFTVWFSFYVLWLILKSIARHKVNLPNHYVSRRSVESDYNPSKRQQETIDQLTVTVLDKIENFQRKYRKVSERKNKD